MISPLVGLVPDVEMVAALTSEFGNITIIEIRPDTTKPNTTNTLIIFLIASNLNILELSSLILTVAIEL
jgi:hypothetical protein